VGAGPFVVLIQPHPYHHHDLSGFAGPPEQSIEEEWQKLQEHPDILAAAPDDEVLAELLAVQVSLHRWHHRQNSPYLALHTAYAVMVNALRPIFQLTLCVLHSTLVCWNCRPTFNSSTADYLPC
jgi:hypothetical protein